MTNPPHHPSSPHRWWRLEARASRVFGSCDHALLRVASLSPARPSCAGPTHRSSEVSQARSSPSSRPLWNKEGRLATQLWFLLTARGWKLTAPHCEMGQGHSLNLWPGSHIGSPTAHYFCPPLGHQPVLLPMSVITTGTGDSESHLSISCLPFISDL